MLRRTWDTCLISDPLEDSDDELDVAQHDDYAHRLEVLSRVIRWGICPSQAAALRENPFFPVLPLQISPSFQSEAWPHEIESGSILSDYADSEGTFQDGFLGACPSNTHSHPDPGEYSPPLSLGSSEQPRRTHRLPHRNYSPYPTRPAIEQHSTVAHSQTSSASVKRHIRSKSAGTPQPVATDATIRAAVARRKDPSKPGAFTSYGCEIRQDQENATPANQPAAYAAASDRTLIQLHLAVKPPVSELASVLLPAFILSSSQCFTNGPATPAANEIQELLPSLWVISHPTVDERWRQLVSQGK
ncbi:hypothetical protein B0H14DRAFT_3158260 [Mycena olivaceomarginata]|nr:hypothetical protein B0H14DRAFT_3158260 [Mycena olivaceomarginata]